VGTSRLKISWRTGKIESSRSIGDITDYRKSREREKNVFNWHGLEKDFRGGFGWKCGKKVWSESHAFRESRHLSGVNTFRTRMERRVRLRGGESLRRHNLLRLKRKGVTILGIRRGQYYARALARSQSLLGSTGRGENQSGRRSGILPYVEEKKIDGPCVGSCPWGLL